MLLDRLVSLSFYCFSLALIIISEHTFACVWKYSLFSFEGSFKCFLAFSNFSKRLRQFWKYPFWTFAMKFYFLMRDVITKYVFQRFCKILKLNMQILISERFSPIRNCYWSLNYFITRIFIVQDLSIKRFRKRYFKVNFPAKNSMVACIIKTWVNPIIIK